MIVFSPSLPPESCTTTRMLSSATSVPVTLLANAIFCTNSGTVPPSDRTPRPLSPTFNRSRRDDFISGSNGDFASGQLIFRRRHHQVQHVAHLAVDHVLP